MKRVRGRSCVIFCLLFGAVGASFGAGKGAKDAAATTPLPMDWSHSHVVFSRPRAEHAGQVQKDPRYQQQLMRQNLRPHATLQSGGGLGQFSSMRRRRRVRKLHPDWSVNLGAGGTVGAAKYPAKFSFDLNVAKCGVVNPDFVIYGTGLPGSSGPTPQPSIHAFSNLYLGCPSGPVPADYWSYNTDGTVLSSPVISLDGTQVAFVQSKGVTSSLVLLKWKAFDGLIGNPTHITPVTASQYASCPILPCMAEFDLGALNTNSSVYYDYGNDMAWVGDDLGNLHEFTGVFNGTPAEVIGGGWPAAISMAALTSPVHDDRSRNTFVNDSAGFLYRVDGDGVAIASARLDFGTGLSEGPMIDSSAGSVYVFSSNDSFGFAGV
ncbi:MAG TPA: hypothetical protein VL128_12200, partial [Candidatus Eisenbacteria bacterium]|nr:hypothetical protein [Candidatus Eisenbacteria bacterium]